MITSLWCPPGTQSKEASAVWAAAGIAPGPALSWTLVFLDEGTPIGAGCLGYVSAGLAELSHLCMLPGRRGEGLGDGLVKALILKAEGLGMKWAIVHCGEDVSGFFETIDFQAESRDPETGVITMRRELGIGFKCNCAHQ